MPDAPFLVRRRIDFVVRLANKTFTESSTDTVTISGLRCSAAISKAGLETQGALDLRAYGMTDSLMRQLSQLANTPGGLRMDQITILAGDDVHGMSVAYVGTIQDAWTDYSDAPGAVFRVFGIAAGVEALKPVPPSSYRGAVDAAQVMSDLAALMGKQFENNGVSGVILSNPYFPGTAYEQFERCRNAARINATIDDGVLAIWPRGGNRGGAVPLVSPTTGLVGYPQRVQAGVMFTTLYNPAIRFGGNIRLETSNTPAAGTWNVINLAHTLESETPNGQWFTAVEANTPNVA